MGDTVFAALLQHIAGVEGEQGKMKTQALLNVCREFLPVVGKAPIQPRISMP